MKNKNIFEKCFLIILVIINVFMYIMEIYITEFWAYITLFLSFLTILKFKNNIALFFMFFCIFYFEYSFIVSRYISSTPILPVLYEQIRFDSTYFIGISGVMFFHIGILLFSPKSKDVVPMSSFLEQTQDKEKNIVSIKSIILTAFISLFIFNYQIFTIIPLPRTLYEYLIIFFVLAFYYARNEKIMKKVLFVLMFINVAIDFLQGGRAIVLQPILAWLFLCFSKYLTAKRMTIVAVVGLIFFTALGIYGDNISMGRSISESLSYVSPHNMINTFQRRKLALDTSVSAYWTGLTFVEMSNIHSIDMRVGNFVDYISKYTILGGSSGYEQLYEQSLQYYIHYNGGIISNYAFYWLGYIGILLLGAIFGKILQYFSSLQNNASEFSKIFFIYFISTMPRWFLYYPTPLIRGTVLLFIVYVFINFITSNKRKEKKYE